MVFCVNKHEKYTFWDLFRKSLDSSLPQIYAKSKSSLISQPVHSCSCFDFPTVFSGAKIVVKTWSRKKTTAGTIP